MLSEKVEKIITAIRDEAKQDLGIVVVLLSKSGRNILFIDKITAIETLGLLEFEKLKFFKRMEAGNVLDEN